jgi:glycosyltransferase involved in cell wall biosynthesis
MRIGIDATNIRAGGGLTHLSEMLKAARPAQHGIDRVVVWGGKPTLERLPERAWLEAETLADPPGRMPGKLFWQQQQLSKLARDRCDLLFVPGGTYTGSFRPFVTMSQNLLPFEPAERARFGLSWPGIRYRMLERSQTATFRRAAGVIFLTETARRIVSSRTGPLPGRTTVVPLGIAGRFACEPRARREPTPEQPFRWLYVSIVNLYKHQWHVVDAAARLRSAGKAIALDLIGPAHPPALARLERAIATADAEGSFVRYRGAIPHTSLADAYHQADGFVFASSCENMPNILVEAMASGLPIACSDRGPMPEVLGDAGVYFDPEAPQQIAAAMGRLMDDPELRDGCARRAHGRARIYSWERCADETFAFLSEIAQEDRGIAAVGARRSAGS